MLWMLTGFGPLLANVAESIFVVPTRTAPKLKELGEKTASTPVPDNGTTRGLPIAVLVIVRAPVFAPTLVGLKFTPTLQLANGFKKPQVENDRIKSGLTVMVGSKDVFPVLVSVTILDTLVVLTP